MSLHWRWRRADKDKDVRTPMLHFSRQMLALAGLYVIGLLVLWGLSIHNLFIDYAGKDSIAMWIVLPMAWTFGYWPMAGSMLMALRVRRLQSTLERVATRAREQGSLAVSDRANLMALLVDLAAGESGLPRFVVRPVVRRIVASSAQSARTPTGLDS